MTVPHMQRVDEMRVPDPRRSRCVERIDCVFNSISKPLNHVRNEEETGAIEAVVAMHSDEAGFLLAADLVDEVNEDFDFVG